jgi:wyosine [tRNA(Phe)-imidazoG37] synthetase (radical SAM superfamily)
MTIPLQSKIVYGPVNSRRLGVSLGLNILPISKKICSFDCIYCQYRNTNICKLEIEEKQFPSISVIHQQIEKSFLHLHKTSTIINYITFAGNGEPTLHPKFDEIVDIVVSLRNKWLKGVPIAILSNSSTIMKEKIVESLKKLDLRIMKLDAGEEELFKKINNPTKEVKFLDIVEGLKKFKSVVIQTLFIDGNITNTSSKAVNLWMKLLKYISPIGIQLYTISRPPSSPFVKKVPFSFLLHLCSQLKNSSLTAQAFK